MIMSHLQLSHINKEIFSPSHAPGLLLLFTSAVTLPASWPYCLVPFALLFSNALFCGVAIDSGKLGCHKKGVFNVH
jgi:hypothetical protein